MDNLRKSIISLFETGIDKVDYKILLNLYMYENIKIYEYQFGLNGLYFTATIKPCF